VRQGESVNIHFKDDELNKATLLNKALFSVGVETSQGLQRDLSVSKDSKGDEFLVQLTDKEYTEITEKQVPGIQVTIEQKKMRK